MQPEFQKTLQAADQVGVPASPLGGTFPELSKFFANTFSSPTRQAGLGAYAVQNQIATGNAEAGATYARNQKISELKDKAASMDPTDINNYQQIAKGDGGYDFVDPSGNKITVQQYAKVAGKRPDQILSDSTNSLDVQHNNDYNNLQKLINLSLNATDDANKKKRDEFAKQIGGGALVDFIKSSGPGAPHDLVQRFMDYYPHIYGGPNNSSGSLKTPQDTVQQGGAYGPVGG